MKNVWEEVLALGGSKDYTTSTNETRNVFTTHSGQVAMAVVSLCSV